MREMGMLNILNKIKASGLLLLLLPMLAQAQRIVFTPQWTPQSQFAGYYVALEKGFYKEAGLDVDFQHPSASYSARNRLMEGSSDIITMQLQEALVDLDRGVEMVNILQTSQHNGLCFVSRHDNLRTLEDLRGKKVGVWKVGFGDLARILDVERNLDVQWISFVENINLYISGAIDATLAMSYNEYLQIQAAGYEDKPVMLLSDEGFDYPEDGLYVSMDFYRRYPEKAKAFAEASKRGWEYAHKKPKEALDIVMKIIKRENLKSGRYHQEKMLEEILRLQFDTPESAPSFELHPEDVRKLSDLLLKYRRINEPVTYEMLKGGKP